MSTIKIHNIGWVRGSRRHPAEEQIAALERNGLPKKMIYIAGKDVTAADLCNAIVGGEHVWVDGTHRLGSTRAEYAAVLDHMRRKKVTIHDTERGTVLPAETLVAAMSLVADDMREINGEVRMTAAGLHGARGRLGGRKPPAGALSKAQSKAVWHDLENYATDAEAATICGVSTRTLRRWHGRSGRPPGIRPSKTTLTKPKKT